MIDDINTPDGMFARRSRLAGYLTITYLALVVYTSLHPFSEWRAPAQEVREFLMAPWPAYFTWADLTINVLAYVPVGVSVTLVLMSFLRGAAAATLAVVLAILMSLTIEVLQVFLPGRIPSNADLLCNALGAFVGATLAYAVGGRGILSGRLYRLRQRHFHPGRAVDLCFLLLALWLVTQFNADIRLFGNGDVRQLLPSLPAVGYSPRTYVLLDAAITGLSFCGVALMVTTISRSRPGAALSVIVLMLFALALKTLAANMLFTSGELALWVAPGALWGLLAGTLAWLLLLGAPVSSQIACATTFIALALALVNAAPHNPYLDATLQVSRVGHYKSLIDLTNVVSGVWSFVTIAFLTYVGYRLR
ncbi:MAG: VanZ family protein [Betaproteobacteria bacterium]|jgi:VanZ family protein|nr:MAG: VanZ family protein [Betaproteobacteria bacterium]